MSRPIEFVVGGERVALSVEGQIGPGEQRVLLEGDDDLVGGTAWSHAGFTIAPFLDDERLAQLAGRIRDLLAGILRRAGIPVDETFRLERYHEVVRTDEEHLAAVRGFREGFPVGDLPFDRRVIEERVSEICDVEVACLHPRVGKEIFNIRVSRPGRLTDSNPPHRDVYLDRLRNGVNIYGPIAGSDSRSSLPLIPGSHRWPESSIERTADGAVVDGMRYTVPCVTRGHGEILQLTRPDPGRREVMVFSPYLVHGGAYNLNRNRTRVSLEMRFWRR